MLRNFSHEKDNKMNQIAPQSLALDMSLGVGETDTSSRDENVKMVLRYTRKDRLGMKK